MPKRRPSSISSRPVIIVCLFAIAVWACFIRCMHLFNPDHYYIISPDSHFFHWQAERVLQGESIRTLGSGLSLPLAYTAKAISFVFGMSSSEALKAAGILLPLALTVLGAILIYLAVSRLYDQRVGLFSAFAWAIASPAVFVTAAGYLDRDGLSVILTMIGAFAFYLSRDWHWRIRGIRIGWIVGALLVLAIEGLLVIEWTWYGIFPLVSILVTFFIADVLVRFARHMLPGLMAEENPLAWPLTMVRRLPSSIVAAAKASDWPAFTLVMAPTVLAGSIVLGLSRFYEEGAQFVQGTLSGTATVEEMNGITSTHLLSYGLLTIPLIIGLYMAITNWRRADIFCLTWIGCLLLGALFANRLLPFTAPAVCVVAGLGLAYLFDFGKLRLSLGQLPRYAKPAFAVILVLLSVLLSFSFYRLGNSPRLAANNDWEAALTYLKDNTPEKAVIMSWWDYGYWILDIADRQPVVGNGTHPEKTDRDIALVYVTTSDYEASQIMRKYKADYLVFSTVECYILPGITYLALGKSYGDGNSIPQEIQGSLYSRALSGDLQCGGGLQRVYPDSGVEKPAVVILGFG